MKSALIIFDIDNTLVCSHEIYEKAYLSASRAVLGMEFSMLSNPDGSKDDEFTKDSTSELLMRRCAQLSINPSNIDHDLFYEKLGEYAYRAITETGFTIYRGVEMFLDKLRNDGFSMVLLSSGPKKLQKTVIDQARLTPYFNIRESQFLGEFETKKDAIEHMASLHKDAESVIHFSDGPRDMEHTKNAEISQEKIAIGVTIQGLSTEKEMIDAGADCVIDSWDEAAYKKVINLLN